MKSDYLFANAETNTRAINLGGKKRHEDAIQHVSSDPNTIVFN